MVQTSYVQEEADNRCGVRALGAALKMTAIHAIWISPVEATHLKPDEALTEKLGTEKWPNSEI